MKYKGRAILFRYKRNSLYMYLLNLQHVIMSRGGENDFPVSIDSLLHVLQHSR